MAGTIGLSLRALVDVRAPTRAAEALEISDAQPSHTQTESRASSRRPRDLPAGAILLDRFAIRTKLGQGGMGQVFSALDSVRQTQVALKILGELNPDSIRQIKREFRTVAELVHPNVVRLHELFSDGSEWFFTMDLVDGVTLPVRLEHSPTSSRADLVRTIFGQLAGALRDLHRVGTLHGDLKPSNFLVTDQERVVLLDFGLSRPLGPGQEREFAGTPAYMAPEQAMGDVLTEAADWYSFGVVLYQALTGALPQRRPSEARLAGAPAELAQLCLELLAIDPAARPSGEDVLRRLRRAPVPGHALLDRRPHLAPPPSRSVLVGRQGELAVLDEAYSRMLSGKPAMVILRGPSGIGKTVLVERFVQEVTRRGASVFVGRCRERESMGYKAADGLLDDIVSLLERLDRAAAAALLPEDISELTILFPALRLVPAVATAPEADLGQADQRVVRHRAIEAFRALLSKLRERAPLVIWLDDLQWSDEESALLLGRVLGGPDAVPLLFVGSHRSERGGKVPLLDALFRDPDVTLPDAEVITVGPLNAADSAHLALELLPGAPDAAALVQSIVHDAAGHPLFIAELAHSSRAGDEPPDAPTPTSLAELVTRRIASLDSLSRGLLETVAVAGVPRSRALLTRAEGLTPSDAEHAIDVLKANRLARSAGLRAGDAVDTHHDRVREIVVSGLDEARRRQCHLALAKVVESEPDERPEVVAAHYEGAGDLVRAARHWLAGAEQAFKALAFQHAADLYAKAIDLGSFDAAARLEYDIRRAEALAYAGKAVESADLYLETATVCGPERALELRRRAAEQLLLSGHLDRGLVVIEQVLATLGMRKTRSGRAALPALVAGRLLVRARGLRHRPRTESEIPAAELARVDASWTIACSLSVIDFTRGAEFQNRHLLLALRAGEPKRLLRALTLEVSYAATPGAGSERRTARLLAFADELTRARDDHAATSFLCLTRAIAAYLQGRTDASLSHCEEALSILTRHCAGAVWETVTAHRFAIASLFFLGRLRSLAAYVPPLLAEAETTGNRYAMMCFRAGYSAAAWLAHDDVAEARRQLDRVREQWNARGFQLSHYNLLIAETFLDLYTGQAVRAHGRIVTQWRAITNAQFLRVGVLRVQLLHLRAATACAASEAAALRAQHSRSRELLVEARETTERLRNDPMRRAAPLADLVSAAVDRALGDREAAIGRLGAAVRAFEAQGLGLFAAAARVRLGELLGGEVGATELRAGTGAFEREGIVRPDRMVALLAPMDAR